MFTESEFNNLSFPVNKAKTGTLPKSLPQLSVIKSFWDCNHNDKDKLIRYIVYMYDLRSPFVRVFTNIEIRKQNALVLAGYNLADPVIENYKEFKDELFTEMVMEFLIYLNDYTWTMLCSNEQTFYEFQKTLLQESAMIRNDKDKIAAIASKAKLMEESDNIFKRIKEYRETIFGEKKLVDKSALKAAVSPEQMAQIS